MIDEIHITITTHQGFQASVEVNVGDRWRYLGCGVSDWMVDAVYGTATPDEIHPTIEELSRHSNESPARYAAHHREHSRKLFEYERDRHIETSTPDYSEEQK